MLTVKTEANGDSKSANDRLVGPLSSSYRYKRILSCLGCPSRLSTVHFFLTVHYFSSFVPIAQQDVQAVVLGRFSVNVCLLYPLPPPPTPDTLVTSCRHAFTCINV